MPVGVRRAKLARTSRSAAPTRPVPV